ncbi:MAG: hypothetical protein AB7L09_01960 [Nitrospira sp.]
MNKLVKAVREHAQDNYEAGGWDYVVECYDDKEIAEVIERAGAKTEAAAIKAVGEEVGARDDYRREIEATAF